MATHHPRKPVELRDLTYWDALTVIFAAFTLVSALGEWVFHWWHDPGDLASFTGIILTILAAGFSASKKDVRRLDRRLASADANLARIADGQERLERGQAEQTALLREVVASFRREQR
jgi:hypothetical protein